MHTHYDNLKVMRGAPPEVIRAAYKALSQRYHPDKNPGPDAQRIMRIINDAYEVLGDPERRSAYDRKIAEQEKEQRQQQRSEPSSQRVEHSFSSTLRQANDAPRSAATPSTKRKRPTVSAVAKTSLLRKIIVGLIFGILIVFSLWLFRSADSPPHLVSTTLIDSHAYVWNNPLTGQAATIDSRWQVSASPSADDRNDEPVYTFKESSGLAMVVIAREVLPNFSMRNYVPAYLNSTASTTTLLGPAVDGSAGATDNEETWFADGHLTARPDVRVHVELRHIGSAFWRVVVVQSLPYMRTDDAASTLKQQLWGTVAGT